MSIGGLPALNDGNNARCDVYNRLINKKGVQIVLSNGNSGPGVNTAGDPAVCSDAIGDGRVPLDRRRCARTTARTRPSTTT